MIEHTDMPDTMEDIIKLDYKQSCVLLYSAYWAYKLGLPRVEMILNFAALFWRACYFVTKNCSPSTMADVQLTPNAIKTIYSAQTCPQPVLQIVDVKKVVPNPGQQQQSNQDRYRFVPAPQLSICLCKLLTIVYSRLLISDGTHYQQGMLGTQQNSLIKDGKLVNNTIVRLTEYVCNTTANNRR